MAAAKTVLRLTRRFPAWERYELTSQIRRCVRSVCANIAEAWRKRRYPASFAAKLIDAEAEAAETQVWLEFAFEAEYITLREFEGSVAEYEQVLGQLVLFGRNPERWVTD